MTQEAKAGASTADCDGFEQVLRARAADIEATLEQLLPRPEGPSARLNEAMRYVTLGGGKRLRGFLVIEAARVFGVHGQAEAALRAAAAVECVHAYSLAHDDLPAMDDDDLRRGRPTAHLAYDEATAILAGDALQALAFEILLAPETAASAPVRAEMALILARASGAGGMVGGQMIDIQAESNRQELGADDIRHLQALKTGALLSASVQIGAALAGAMAEARDAARRFGDAVGAVFQIADDLLDAAGDEAEAGKRLRKDEAAGKATLPALLGATMARCEAEARVADAVSALAPFGAQADVLAQAARFALARRR